MCTLIALHRCVPGRPLVVAANRDEYRDRPSEGPRQRSGPRGGFVAPRDLREGGTWLGLGAGGVFAAITNRPVAARDPQRRSRGLLVVDALASGGAAEAAAALERLPVGAYNPFNLLVADAREAYVAVYEEEVKVYALGPGAHVIGNADPNDAAVPKIARLRIEAENALQLPAHRVLDALAETCRVHVGGETPLADTCIHAGDYGTRSSTLLALGDDPADHVLRYAEGPPCEAKYDEFTHLLRELDAGRVATGEPTRTTT